MRDDVLIILLGRTLTHREIATRLDADVPEVRQVCERLLQHGLVFVGGDKAFGTRMYPAFELTSAGEHEAHAARTARRNAEVLGSEKKGHDSVQEVRG